MSLFLNILHYSIYFFSFVCLLSLIIRGSKAKVEALYISIFFLIQSIYNGCPLTTIQNYFWIREGYLPVDNQFIFSELLPVNTILLRIVFSIISTLVIINFTLLDK